MLEKIKKEVYEANLELAKSGLVILTWGNVSQIDREKGLIVIKPSGVDYSSMKLEDMVVVDMKGNVVEGKHTPSSDLLTHIELYKNFPNIHGITHTHSTFATSFAQAGEDIVVFGTTHADTFYGNIPCTEKMSKEEIENNYGLNTGKIIVRTFKDKDYESIPAVLVHSHGPFIWGKSAKESVKNAIILEEVSKMAYLTKTINSHKEKISQDLLNKHYHRKHGKNAYYGQKENKDE